MPDADVTAQRANVSFVGGRLRVASGWGSKAVPLATIAVDAGVLAQIVIGANTIGPNNRLVIEAVVVKTGANAISTVTAYLGTAGGITDAPVGAVATASTDGAVGKLACSAAFGVSKTSFFDGTVDRVTHVDTTKPMTLTLGVALDADDGDQALLIGYNVWLEV